MAKQVNTEENSPAIEDTIKQQATKRVRNRNPYKVELFVDGKVVVFPPKKSVDIPANFSVPSNLGLYTER